jgi:hypothetical protein
MDFGFEQYGQLAIAGFWGLVPVVAWLDALAGPSSGGVATRIFAGLLICACPALPCLVLWLRQPRGARVTWDDRAIVEWSGGRAVARVAWDRAQVRARDGAGKSTFTSFVLKRRPRSSRALQLFDVETGSAITIVDGSSSEAPTARRRLETKSIDGIASAIRARGLVPVGDVDWSLAGSRTRGAPVYLGRLGYPCVVIATVLRQSPNAVLWLASIGAALLLLRAWPAARELFARRAPPRPPVRRAPEGGTYRSPQQREPDHEPAASPTLRAAIALELGVRMSFVLLSVAVALETGTGPSESRNQFRATPGGCNPALAAVHGRTSGPHPQVLPPSSPKSNARSSAS